MGIARVQHTYNHFNGLPIDAVVNSFYFTKIATDFGVSVADATTLIGLVTAFYDTSPGTGLSPIASHIAESTMAAQRHGFKVYDELAPKPSVPVVQTTTQNGRVNLTAAGYPAEVALCMSYRAKLSSGQPAAQRRGRIYLGPLTSTAGDNDVATKHVRPTAWIADVVGAGKKLALDAQAAGFRWCVRHNAVDGAGAPNNAYYPITYVWVDNAFDTQRRRGPKPTTRTADDFQASITAP